MFLGVTLDVWWVGEKWLMADTCRAYIWQDY